MATLGELGSWSGGGTPSKGRPEFWTNGTIPWVSPKDMKVDVIRRAMDSITPDAMASSSAAVIPKGAVLVVVRSGILQHSLPVALSSIDVTVNQDLKALNPVEGIRADYVTWALRRYEQDILDTCSRKGTTVQNIEFPRLRRFPIPLPPTREQVRIVAAIEEHLSRLDAAATGLRRVQALIPRYRAAVLTAASEGRLPDAPPGPFPNERLGNLLAESPRNGRSVPTATVGFPVLRLTAIRDGRVDLVERKVGAWTAEQAHRYLVNRLDFFVVRGNGSLELVGRGGLVVENPDPVAFPDTLIRVRAKAEQLLPQFLSLIWDSPSVRHQLERRARTSAGIHKVNQDDICGVNIPLPTTEQQKALVTEVDRRLSLVGAVKREVEAGLIRTARLRQAILKRAFEGRLVPQDPGDEPASFLLERIRASRAMAGTPRQKRKAARA